MPRIRSERLDDTSCIVCSMHRDREALRGHLSTPVFAESHAHRSCERLPFLIVSINLSSVSSARREIASSLRYQGLIGSRGWREVCVMCSGDSETRASTARRSRRSTCEERARGEVKTLECLPSPTSYDTWLLRWS